VGKSKIKGVFVTGHSFGGAVAVLVGWKLWEQGYLVMGIFTYGQPRVVTKDTVNNLKTKTRKSDGGTFRSQVTYERYTNATDPVSGLPLKSLGFVHFDHEQKIQFGGSTQWISMLPHSAPWR
jgi:predicted NodU family carbamoyl transferase